MVVPVPGKSSESNLPDPTCVLAAPWMYLEENVLYILGRENVFCKDYCVVTNHT